MNTLKRCKSLVIIFIIVLFVSWILAVLRFHYDWAYFIARILLFPFGISNFYLDDYLWLHFGPTHFLNNEFVSLFIFCTAIVGQVFFYYWIYKTILKKGKTVSMIV
jgi:hypothetical protein